MKAELINKEKVKDFAEVLAETPVQVEMSALDLLLITTTLGHSSTGDRREGLERTVTNIRLGMMVTHPLAVLSPVQRNSVLQKHGAFNWDDMKKATIDILKQLGVGE